MSIDPSSLHRESFAEIGAYVELHADALVNRWALRAVLELPSAEAAHRQELRDHLPSFLQAMGRQLAQNGADLPPAYGLAALAHGETRWQAGWRLAEVIRDYQILRLVILEALDEAFDRPIEAREMMAVGLALDEAIAAAAVAYVSRQELELRQESAVASEANRLKSEFLANMSHEIRTPMTAILGFSELLLGNAKDPQTRDAAHTIKRNGEYLLEIVNDILDLSKIEANRMDLERMPTLLIDLIRDVETLVQVRAAAKALPLTIEFATRVPKRVFTDSTRVRQILVNLLGNAVKFTERGFVRLTVRMTRSDDPPARLEFEVADSGIGMSQEQIDGLFRPFTQADSSMSRRFGGTGLGLAISKRLSAMLGGDITVVSQIDAGSRFTFSLELSSQDTDELIDPLDANATSKSKRTKLKRSESQVRCRVLAADDRRDNQHLITAILKAVGAEVVVVDNGVAALDMVHLASAEGKPFDVIFLDMQMPVLNGYDAAQQLRAEGVLTPIIALTASAMNGDRDRCLAAGCDDYLPKPIHRQHLLEIISRYERCEPAEGKLDGGS